MLEQWFPESASAVARDIDRLFWYSASWTGATGLIVITILASFLLMYRRRSDRSAFYTHGNSKGSLFLTLSLAASVFLLLDVNLAYRDHLVWSSMFGSPPLSAEALKVEIMPEQFAWNVRYAGPDAAFGTIDDIVVMNELHVPVNQTVIVQLSSKDVIHSFFLPNLRIKQDAIPGMVTSLYFSAEKTGAYNIACAQHCGLGHYRMKGAFIVDTAEEFKAWLAAQAKESAASPAAPWAWDWDKGLVPGSGPAKKEPLS
jgi:cytochrome c oxidase subunit 2